MEIIHIVSERTSNIHQSLSVALDQLATEQVNLGYSVKLWEISEHANAVFHQRTYNTQQFHVKHFIGYTPKEIIKAIESLKKGTVIHIHGGFNPIYFSIAFQLKKRDIPFVYTSHGIVNKTFLESAGFFKTLYFHFFEQMLIQWSSALHFEGQHEKALYIETTKELSKNIAVIPLGLTNNKVLVTPKIKKNIIPVFGYMGNLNVEQSGLDILLYAFAEYKHKYLEKGELWIVGEGKEKEELQALTRMLHIDHAVRFIPDAYGNKKVELLNQIDAFVMPSRYEYNPFAILEAAAASVPSIVSKETNMGEYITAYDAGYMLSENTPNILAKAFISVLKDHHNHQWDCKRRNAYRMVSEKFQWTNIAKEHISLYTKVLLEEVA